MVDSSVGAIPAEFGVCCGGSIRGETVGAKSEGLVADWPPGVSKPVKAGRAGRLAKREVGFCPYLGDDGRVGSLASSEVGGSFFSMEEESVCIANFRRLISSASSSLTFDIKSCFSFLNSSISASLSFMIPSSICFSLRKPCIL